MKTYWKYNNFGKKFSDYYYKDIIYPEFNRVTGKTKKEFYEILDKEYNFDHFIPEIDDEIMNLDKFISDYQLDMENIRQNSLQYGFDYDEQIGRNDGLYYLHMLNQCDE